MESVAEIGSWKGRSTFALCSSGCQRIWAVDHFLGSSEHWAEYEFSKGWSPFPEFRRNILECFKNVTLKRMSSAEASKDFNDGSVDLVYIDGAREFDLVLENLALWSPKARKSIAVQTADLPPVRHAFTHYFGRQPDQVVGDIWVLHK